MGLDVQIYAITKPTSELVEKLNALFEPARNEPWGRSTFPAVHAVESYDESMLDHHPFEPHISISFMDRYFGQGYARGHWPTIKGYIAMVKEACPPGTRVLYGQDCSTYAQEADEELLDELDRLWEECVRGREERCK